MLATRLVFVDGVMGSGKSTLSGFLARELARRGRVVRHVAESFHDHPTYFTPTLPHPWRPWLDVSPEALVVGSLQRWQALVAAAQPGDVTLVYDGQLFHGDLTSLFMADTARAELVAYLDSLLAIIAPLQPSFIYLYQADVARALTRTADLRGSAWLERQVSWKVASPYGQRRGLAGMPGWLQLYTDFRALTDALYQRLPEPKLAIDNGDLDWAAHARAALAFLAPS